MARILDVSARTLSRHRQGFNSMPVSQEHNFSQIADVALDNIIRDVLTPITRRQAPPLDGTSDQKLISPFLMYKNVHTT